jgi:hypothetical protein
VIAVAGAYLTMTTRRPRSTPPRRAPGGGHRAVERNSWFQRRNFRQMLARLHRFTRLRDNGQHYVVKLLLPMRRSLRRAGARAGRRAAGWPAADDIFFLVAEELTAVTTTATRTRRGWTGANAPRPAAPPTNTGLRSRRPTRSMRRAPVAVEAEQRQSS